MPDVEVGGHSFQYMELDGERPTVLLLCSTGLDSKQWKGIIPHLEGRRTSAPTTSAIPERMVGRERAR